LANVAKPLAEHPYDALWWSMIVSNLVAAVWQYLIYKRGTWKKTKFH
jgi:Na+-driven multidrug efflux pump